MTASERRPTLGSKESRSCELQVSNGQPSFKSDEHHVEEWSAQCAQRSALMPLRRQREPAGSASPSRWLRLLHRQHSASLSSVISGGLFAAHLWCSSKRQNRAIRRNFHAQSVQFSHDRAPRACCHSRSPLLRMPSRSTVPSEQ